MASFAPSVQRPATIIVINPSGNRTRLPLQSFPFGIGRQSDNNLVLRDNRASRNHARIVQENDEFYIEDLKSSHGVYVNGTRVLKQRLFPADKIEFGIPDSYHLVFTYEDDEIQKILDQFPTAQAVSPGAGNLAKLRALVEVARALQNSLSTDDVLAAVVNAALAITGLERGFLLLGREDSSIEVRLARERNGGHLSKADLKIPIASIWNALHQRTELLSMTFDPRSSELQDSDYPVVKDVRGIVCVPLVRVRARSTEETCLITSKSDTVGVLYLDSQEEAIDLSHGNRELLQTLALEASTILENARLLEEERIKQRMEEELAIAREIQTSLLPRKLPSEGWFRAAGSSVPSREVGGDCFDVRQVSNQIWSAVVIDVSGKGVSSALLAALLQGGFLLASDDPSAIEQMMSRLNLFLNERTEGEKYATAFYCTVNFDGTVRWANAGHCTPFVVSRGGELRPLGTTGLPLGMLPGAQFGVESLRLDPGDKIVACSDGLTESQNKAGEFLETKRLHGIIKKHSTATAAELHSILVNEEEAFTAGATKHDDITILVIEFLP